MGSSRPKTADWLAEGFHDWDQHCSEKTLAHNVTSLSDIDSDSPCRLVVRCRHARSTWEKMVKMVVGNPVHLDVVLPKSGTHYGRFCFSAYMNQKLEMRMMSQDMVLDDDVSNLFLDITDEEHRRCIEFMTCLEGKAAYDYVDAMVLMPMAPKGSWGQKGSIASAIFNVLVDDCDPTAPQDIKKVFCSQSVVLMLRYALDSEGNHSGLLQKLNGLNSKLVSPKQVQDILVSFGAKEMSNSELAALGLEKVL